MVGILDAEPSVSLFFDGRAIYVLAMRLEVHHVLYSYDEGRRGKTGRFVRHFVAITTTTLISFREDILTLTKPE